MRLGSAIFLDANAGAPLRPPVRDALRTLLGEGPVLLGNPSSIHLFGRHAKKRLNQAREQVAHGLGSGVDPAQIVFTSSATESNQAVVRSVLEREFEQGRKPHWILSSVEHDSNIEMIDWVRARGGSVDFLKVDADGIVQIAHLREIWRPNTRLLSLIWVNNETGVISPLREFITFARERGALTHVDGVQAWGKLELKLLSLGADYATFSAHKIGGLPGVGILWTRPGAPEVSALVRGKQENAHRGGTENLLGIIALGIAASTLPDRSALARSRDEMEKQIHDRIPGVRVNGSLDQRVGNTSNLRFSGIIKDGLVQSLDLVGYAVSAGSACSSGAPKPSRVLQAMGLTDAEARASVRISLVEPWDSVELTRFVDTLAKVVSRMRGESL